MNFVANYEIKAECSVVDDDLVLKIKHPKGLYRARIQNILRETYATPFLLSLHLYFDAESLQHAKQRADDLLADCLNMLAFTTGSRLRRHRIRQIVDASPQQKNGMRSLLYWGDYAEHEDPQPFITDDTARAIEKLSEFDLPPAIRRAMRWYRIGVNATVPDDQFIYFWFALEIIAEFQKSTEKVADKCSNCRSPLYCETCKKTPLHRPYAKQAINALLKAVDKDCDDATIVRLDKTRNSLMHGSTLAEIEKDLGAAQDHVVDVLGRLLWRALILQFPKENFDGTLAMGYPSTHLHRTVHGIAHINTVVPSKPDGDLDLSFNGLTMELVLPNPPQSGRPTVVTMSLGQHKRLQELKLLKGDHQEMCQRISEGMKIAHERAHALVLSTDMAIIKAALRGKQVGAWQDLFREILEAPEAG